MDSELTSGEVRAELKKVSDELHLLRNSRSQLAGKPDPISKRNIKHLSVSIRRKHARHEELRQILITRGELDK